MVGGTLEETRSAKLFNSSHRFEKLGLWNEGLEKDVIALQLL
jgi:hypothetical protein